VPGLHKDQPAAENFELRRQKIPGIHLLELIVKALDVVGAMIFQQCLTLFKMARRTTKFANPAAGSLAPFSGMHQGFSGQRLWANIFEAGVMPLRASQASKTAAAVQPVFSSGQITVSGNVTPIQ